MVEALFATSEFSKYLDILKLCFNFNQTVLPQPTNLARRYLAPFGTRDRSRSLRVLRRPPGKVKGVP
jgi:hypothetical protein